MTAVLIAPNKIGVVDRLKILSSYMARATEVFEHFKEKIVDGFRNAKIPNRKSVEDGLIQKNSDFMALQRKITQASIKNGEIMFFIKSYIPFGSKKITTTQDDCIYNRKNYYTKEELSLEDQTFKI